MRWGKILINKNNQDPSTQYLKEESNFIPLNKENAVLKLVIVDEDKQEKSFMIESYSDRIESIGQYIQSCIRIFY